MMDGVLLADGFEEAFIGLGRHGPHNMAVYDYEKCVLILMKKEGWTEEEAVEWMEYNVVGAWVGEQTPVFVETTVRLEDLDE